MDEQILMDDTLRGNEIIEEAIRAFYREQTAWHFMGICMAIRSRIGEDGHLIFPADVFEDEEGNTNFSIFNADSVAHTVTLPEGKWSICVNKTTAGTEVLRTVEGTVEVESTSL